MASPLDLGFARDRAGTIPVSPSDIPLLNHLYRGNAALTVPVPTDRAPETAR